MLSLKFSARLSESPRGEPKPPSPQLQSLPHPGIKSCRNESLDIGLVELRGLKALVFLTRGFFGFPEALMSRAER